MAAAPADREEADAVDHDAVRAAAARLTGVARETPMLEDDLLNAAAGRRVLVKAECLQRTGSFKFRGAWSRLSAMDGAGLSRGVVAFSSGNHAQGVALAARLLGARAVIVMPADAPAVKIADTRARGAEVVLYDRAGGEDRDALAAALVAREGLTLVRPYDDPFVIAGQGTCGLEIARQAAAAGVARADVLTCCGGGGLAAGLALAFEGAAPGLRVRTVEPEGHDDMRRSLAAGRRLSNPPDAPATLCDAIVTPTPGALTFPVLRRLAGPGLAVPDAEALAAMAAAFRRLKIALEPGGAVALAAALSRRAEIEGEAVIVIGSGGSVAPAVFAQALAAA
ncbi:MAG: pyridoxal-phosphate dependent enzyme [Rhodobacteraceae bacterium]|nr:MAG: pyridoxal-phosphate dependent enzyme [Paracoccaceae bacterium]